MHRCDFTVFSIIVGKKSKLLNFQVHCAPGSWGRGLLQSFEYGCIVSLFCLVFVFFFYCLCFVSRSYLIFLSRMTHDSFPCATPEKLILAYMFRVRDNQFAFRSRTIWINFRYSYNESHTEYIVRRVHWREENPMTRLCGDQPCLNKV